MEKRGRGKEGKEGKNKNSLSDRSGYWPACQCVINVIITNIALIRQI